MNNCIILKFLFLVSMHSVLGQDNGKLVLEQNKLIGDCQNKYFTGFVIELDSNYAEIDALNFLNQFPRIGKINFKNRIQIPTEFTITERAGFPQIMFRFRSDYLTFDNLKIENQSISFTIDHDPEVPVTESDLKIIRAARSLLSEEKYWNKQDDRSCVDDLVNKTYSIYCALRISSLEIEEKYNHRNAALQKLRHLIHEKYPKRKWNHRLMDFNNMEETKFEDIEKILNDIEQYFIEELNKLEED